MFPALLLQIIIALVIVGLALWVISQIPMDPTIARIIRVVVIVFVSIWLLYLLVGLLGGVGAMPGPYPLYRR
jgi:hypothetical protein